MMLNKPADQSNGLTESHATTSFESIKKNAYDAADHIENMVEKKLEPMVSGAIENASDFVHNSIGVVRDKSAELQDKARNASDFTVKYIKDEPFKAILIAAATGAALMALLSMLNTARR